jgi:hypothetical protein
MGEGRGAYTVLVRQHEGKRPPGRLRCKWEDKIKMFLQEVGWGSKHLRTGTGGGLSECSNELLGSIKCGEFLD